MDRAELASELERLHPESWAWALACCARDHHLAEDTLQAAYLTILSGRARFDGRSALKTWMFGVIRMSALAEARKWRARPEHAGDVEAAIHVADPSPRADITAEESERKGRLIAALKELSPRQREVLQLVFYHDMTIEHASRVMRVSLGSARTHYDRGKKALAERLGREDQR